MDVGLLFPAYERRLTLGLVLDCAMNHHVRFGNAFEAESTALVFPVQPDAAEIIRVILDIELPVGITATPLMVWNTGGGIDLVSARPAADSELYAGRGESARPGGHNPEDVHHVAGGHRFRVLVYTCIVHLYPGDAGNRMLHFVPLPACLGIFCLQLVKSIEPVPVGLDELKVRTAGIFSGSDILSGKAPVFVQDLALKTPESGFYRLGLPAVRGGGTVDMADLVKQTVGDTFKLLMTALVVMDQLVRLVPACLERHAVSMVLRLIILVLADMEAEQDFTVGIHDLVHPDGADLAALIPVIKVQFGTVTVPQAVTAAGEFGLMLAAVTLVGLHFTVNRIIP